jgi:hypothetical protein
MAPNAIHRDAAEIGYFLGTSGKTEVVTHLSDNRLLRSDRNLDRVASTPGCSARAYSIDNGSGGIRTLSISRSEQEWSAGCLPSRMSPKSVREKKVDRRRTYYGLLCFPFSAPLLYYLAASRPKNTQGGIRTHTRPGLSRTARPVGVPGREGGSR